MPRDTRYAAGTDVSVRQTKDEIERLLERYEATAYGVNVDKTTPAVVIVFQMFGRNIVLRRSLPQPDDTAFTWDRRGFHRAPAEAKTVYDAELRRRWRSILLQLKAKLEAVNDEPEADRAEAFYREFLADTMLADGSRMADWAEAQLAPAYRSGQMPPLLPGGRLALPPGS